MNEKILTLVQEKQKQFDEEYASASLVVDGTGKKSDFVPKVGLDKALSTIAALAQKDTVTFSEADVAAIEQYMDSFPIIMSFKTTDKRRSGFASYTAKLEYFVQHLVFAYK